jgi:hypothetical protein
MFNLSAVFSSVGIEKGALGRTSIGERFSWLDAPLFTSHLNSVFVVEIPRDKRCNEKG